MRDLCAKVPCRLKYSQAREVGGELNTSRAAKVPETAILTGLMTTGPASPSSGT